MTVTDFFKSLGVDVEVTINDDPLRGEFGFTLVSKGQECTIRRKVMPEVENSEVLSPDEFFEILHEHFGSGHYLERLDIPEERVVGAVCVTCKCHLKASFTAIKRSVGGDRRLRDIGDMIPSRWSFDEPSVKGS